MRSIRRSLVLWFLALAFVAFAAVGVVIDSVVRRAVAGREQAAMDLVEKQFELQKQEELERVDQALLDEARGIAQVYQLQSADANSKLFESMRYFPLMSLSFGFENALATIMPIRIGAFNSGPSNAFYRELISNRAYYDALMQKHFHDEEHPLDFYQVYTFGREPFLSKSLDGNSLPDFNRMELVKTLPNWLPADDVKLSTGEVARRVVYITQSNRWFFTPMGGRRGPQNNNSTRAPNPPRIAVPDTTQTITVQTARPKRIIDSKFNEFQSHRDSELTLIRSESTKALTNARTLLVAVGAAGIALILLGSTILISRGLRPVDRLSDAVSQVSERDFRLPIAVSDLSVELVPIHGRLIATLDALRRAFDREKQAVADISHELRTPVASLAATIDVSLRKPRTLEQYRTTLEECRDINRQLGRLVERVMTLANLDAGNDHSVSAPVDIADLSSQCIAMIRPLAEAHGLTVSSKCNSELIVTTACNKVREVLMNLLHNAVEYTPAGGQIELIVKPTKKPGVELIVRDSGIGMTPDVKEKIFERFYRADASRTATGVHAGLGLAIVKEYVNRLGGTVAVESTPGSGSTFTVSVPSLSLSA